MTTADDHWPKTLQRVVGSLDFDHGSDGDAVARPRGDIGQLPALVSLAVHAAIALDKRVAASDANPPVDRKAILARKDMVRAMLDQRPATFVTGYAAAYRVELARVLWAGIADAPRRRLEEMANAGA